MLEQIKKIKEMLNNASEEERVALCESIESITPEQAEAWASLERWLLDKSPETEDKL